jgi:glycosyltransferase involved in cell wall biosynthesis
MVYDDPKHGGHRFYRNTRCVVCGMLSGEFSKNGQPRRIGHPLVTVVTPTTGNPSVFRAIQSVADQTYKPIQHLVVIDNPDAAAEIKVAIREYNVDVIELPYATGKDNYLGHRIIGASIFLGKGDFFCFLDEDNWFDTNHVASLLDVIRSGFTWTFSFRKIVDREGNFICNDDCESLGKWPSNLSPSDYLIDVNCYFLPRLVAVAASPAWFCRNRGLNILGGYGPDRALPNFFRSQFPKYEPSYCYTVNYSVENTPVSVKREFFLSGNQEMLEKFQGHLPWKRENTTVQHQGSERGSNT